MLLFVLIPLLYLMTGMIYARRRYATLSYENKVRAEIEPEHTKVIDRKKQLEENLSALTRRGEIGVRHITGCGSAGWTIPTYNRQYCTCGVYRKVEAYSKELRQIELGEIDGSIYRIEEPAKFKPVLAWPIYMTGDFVSNGTPADSEMVRRAKEIAEAKHNADLAEIRARETAALDRELEASKR